MYFNVNGDADAVVTCIGLLSWDAVECRLASCRNFFFKLKYQHGEEQEG